MNINDSQNKVINTLFFDSKYLEESINNNSISRYLKERLEIKKIFGINYSLKSLLNDFTKTDDTDSEKTNNQITGTISFYDSSIKKWIDSYILEFGLSSAMSVVLKQFKSFIAGKDCYSLTEMLIDPRKDNDHLVEKEIKTCKFVKTDEEEFGIRYHLYSRDSNEFEFEHDGKNVIKIKCDCNEYKCNERKCPCFNKDNCIKLPDIQSCLNRIMVKFDGDYKTIDFLKNMTEENEDRYKNLFKILYIQHKVFKWKYLYCFVATSDIPAGVIYIYSRNRLESVEINFFQILANQLFLQFAQGVTVAKIKNDTIKSAITSILVDSFAHNIAAHSLSALSWYYANKSEKEVKAIQNLKKIIDNDIEQDEQWLKNINIEIEKYTALDKDIAHLLRYIRNKAAFWSGVTRDFACGGEIKTWYEVISEFIANPLFLGTIAHSEGVNIVKINVKYKDSKNMEGQGSEEIDLSALIKEDKDRQYKSILAKDKIILEDIKDVLDSEEFSVFLPNGIVGRHALFTIFENTLRNFKHAIDKTQPVDFNVLIEPSTEEKFQEKQFKVTVWLGNKSKIMETKTKDGKSKLIKVEDELRRIEEQSVTMESGSPRMGGSSQDKICASMLYTNTFSKVHMKRKDAPWIKSNVEEDQTCKEKGEIKKSFSIWKGEIFKVFKEIKSIGNEDNENASRFKFAIVPESTEEKEEIFSKLADQGVIRILELRVNAASIIENDGIYKRWNGSWIRGIKSICLCFGDTPLFIMDNNLAIRKLNTTDLEYSNLRQIIKDNKTIDGIKIIKFKHGKDDEIEKKDQIDHRGQCILGQKYFPRFSRGCPDWDTNKTSSFEQQDFIEALLTRIKIYDNRIFNRAFENGKLELFKEHLFLDICAEENKEGKPELKIDENINFLVVHLSMIEAMGYTEDKFNEFIEREVVEKKYFKDHFRLVITTGRGRSEWNRNIKPEYQKYIIFRPPESLMTGIEDGLILKDDFQVKYNLVKILFGS